MRILIATDAWAPQVNGVVRTLERTSEEARRLGHFVDILAPDAFATWPCPSYPEIRLALARRADVRARIERFAPDAIHVATEGPIGHAVRRYCIVHSRPFTTSFHTRFAEYVHARVRLPLALSYAWLRRFHAPAQTVMTATASLARELRDRRFDRLSIWSRGVDLERFSPRGDRATQAAIVAPRPVFMYVGRVAIEKNVEAFLALDLPGRKVVVGDGPARARLAGRYPAARFVGMQHARLADFYRAADVLVFPSRTDTFGLVLLEAMACGTPVAAFPVQGPIDVVGAGGVLDEDLARAALAALAIPREAARAQAERFSWRRATEQFLGNLCAGANVGAGLAADGGIPVLTGSGS